MSLPSCGLAADETVVDRDPQPPPRSPKKPAARSFAQKKVSGTFRRSKLQHLARMQSSRHLFLGRNTRDQARDCPKRGQDSCIRLENKRCPQDLRSPVPFSDSLLSHLRDSWEN